LAIYGKITEKVKIFKSHLLSNNLPHHHKKQALRVKAIENITKALLIPSKGLLFF